MRIGPWWRGLSVAIFLTAVGWSTPSSARTFEAGKPIAFGQIGPSFLFDGRLGGSSAYLLVGGGVEYPFDKTLSATADLVFGLSGSQQLKIRGGGRYHFTGLDAPISPYAEGGVVFGRLFDLIGTDLGLYGVRVGAGADYFLTGDLIAGVKLGYEMTRTTGPRPVWFNQLEVLITASLVF